MVSAIMNIVNETLTQFFENQIFWRLWWITGVCGVIVMVSTMFLRKVIHSFPNRVKMVGIVWITVWHNNRQIICFSNIMVGINPNQFFIKNNYTQIFLKINILRLSDNLIILQMKIIFRFSDFLKNFSDCCSEYKF